MATEADFEDVDEDASVMFKEATHAREFEFVLTRAMFNKYIGEDVDLTDEAENVADEVVRDRFTESEASPSRVVVDAVEVNTLAVTATGVVLW